MTLNEWLGENNQLGIDIWHNKYQYNNESFDEWLDRVSGNNQEVKELIKEKKFLFGGRILANRGLNKYSKKITYSNCFRGDTEIVTRNGIKKIEDLVNKDIQTFSFGAWRNATVKCFGEQKIGKLTLRKYKTTKDLYVTRDHIWYVRGNGNFEEKKTEHLQIGDIIPISASKSYRTYIPSAFGVAHGAFYGDGDHSGNSRRMNFCGDKKELIPYFSPANIGNSGGVSTICGIPKIFWNKPSLNETPSYLYGWLAGYFATDGSIDERGSCVLCSSKRDDLEFVQDVLTVLGIPCEEIRVQNRLSNLTNKYSDIYILNLNKWYLNESFFILSKHKERFLAHQPQRESEWKVDSVDFSNTKTVPVYCVVEPEKHSFTLKGNILTHNCYVISPPEDNIESIFDCAKKLARTYSYGGGCGIDIGKLSPRGAKINNAAKETSGSTSFMDLYSMVTGLIGQGGRRGALMISIPVDHPDVEEFIHLKSDLNRVTKANISVRISDRFMQAVKNNEDFKLSFTRDETGEVIEKTVNAKNLFIELSKMNWDYAEPGLLFWDRVNNWNLLSEDSNFHYAGTNPCAEEPLPAGGSCLLGSINLSAFVDENGKFNFDDFANTVKISVDALNDVLDEGLPLHPLAEQRESVKEWRQIGLGIMGLADMLIKMGITYGSKEAIDLSDKIGHIMINAALMQSAAMACDNGPYPSYDENAVLSSKFLQYNADEDTLEELKRYGIRNSQILTIAPTGTLSTMLGISGGIEPIFANYYTRKTESLKGHDEYYKVYTKIVKDYMDAHGLKDDSELPEYFVTAHELDYKQRVKMQAAWQRHIDASISSTCNLNHDATVDEVADLYMTAWENGLKGITVYRDGCARTGILTDSESKNDDDKETYIDAIPRGVIIKADDNCVGKKRTLKTGCGTLHVEAFFDPDTGNLLETYFSKGSTGGCNSYMTGLSRMVSLAARGGVPLSAIIDQLKSTLPCPSYAVRSATKHDTSSGSSCPVAIGNALLDMYKEIQEELSDDSSDSPTENFTVVKLPKDTEQSVKNDTIKGDGVNTCPVCGSKLRHTGGCDVCENCGWSHCQ